MGANGGIGGSGDWIPSVNPHNNDFVNSVKQFYIITEKRKYMPKGKNL